MEKEEILSEVSGLLPSTIKANYNWVLKSMDEYAKQENINMLNYLRTLVLDKAYSSEQLYNIYNQQKQKC